MSRPRRGAPLILALAWRFLSGPGRRLPGSTARAALAATGIGVTAMVIAMALMTGYREDLQRRLVRGNAAVIAYPVTSPRGPMPEDRRRALDRLPGVVGVRRVAYGQGSLAGPGDPGGVDVTLRGMPPEEGLGDLGEVELSPAADPVAALAGSPQAGSPLPGVVLGAELARRLAAGPGEPLRLMALGVDDGRPRFRYRSVRMAGTFRTGFAEFDQNWAVIDRERLEELLGGAGTVLYEIAVADPVTARRVAEEVREALGADYLVTDWQDLNRELFTALRVQQIALFFVLGLIVLVSTFNVASSLVVLVRERMRDVGLLAALGLSPGELRAVFLLYGALLGLIGCAAGVALGSGAAWALTRWELVRFDPELAAIYFISSVPFRVTGTDLAAVAGFTLAVTLAACWLPARRAARVEPAVALRYE